LPQKNIRSQCNQEDAIEHLPEPEILCHSLEHSALKHMLASGGAISVMTRSANSQRHHYWCANEQGANTMAAGLCTRHRGSCVDMATAVPGTNMVTG